LTSVPRRVACLLLAAWAASGGTARAEEPEIAYWLQCAGCHRFDGGGLPPEIPSLIGMPGVIEGLPGGREYLVRVPGVAQAALDDEHLAAVLNYMLTTFSRDTLSESFRPYTAAEVSRHRGRVLDNPLKRRAELIREELLEERP
jgi:mono/diheme cytochrome c family protein